MADEPLRRRVRARALHVAAATAARMPRPVVLGGLEMLAWASRFTRYERRTLENLETAFGAELDEARRARIAAGVRRHSARIFYEWLRMARAEGDSRWVEAVGTSSDSGWQPAVSRASGGQEGCPPSARSADLNPTSQVS